MYSCEADLLTWRDLFIRHQKRRKYNRTTTPTKKRPWKKEYFLIVSAISSNHYEEGKDMIGSAQHFLPTRRIVMYDLGLQESQRKELEKFCNVELRTFEFEQYPPHVKSLGTYAWKPIIIRQLALEAEYLFWADACKHTICKRF